MDNQQIVGARLRESCEELLRSIRVASWVVESRTAGATGRQIASVVGFNGPQIRGSMTVRSAVAFFSATRPVAAPNPAAGQDALVDWAGELTNQLLGRFKNKMLAHGLDFQVGLPVTIYGENLMEASVGGDGVVACHFRTTSDVVSVTFVGRFAPEVRLPSEPTGRTVPLHGEPMDL